MFSDITLIMNKIIGCLIKLVNLPVVTVLLGVILGCLITYLFNLKQNKEYGKQVTKQVLLFINMEIHENFSNKIKSKYPYKELSLKGFELIGAQVGNIKINNDQLAKINKIYTLFDEINKKILSVREAKKCGRPTADLAKKLEELQKRCIIFNGEYVKENYSEKIENVDPTFRNHN